MGSIMIKIKPLGPKPYQDEPTVNKSTFKTIGVISKRTHADSIKTSEKIVAYLHEQQYQVFVASDIASVLTLPNKTPIPKALPQAEIGQACDLLVVVGGDGHLLSAARDVFMSEIPLIGVNRGRFGFLADLSPAELPGNLEEVLQGHYQEEPRRLITAKVIR